MLGQARGTFTGNKKNNYQGWPRGGS